MKDHLLDARLTAARPKNHKGDSAFTDKVMANIKSPEILSSAVRNMDVNKKETFIMKFKHLPKFAVVAIGLAVALALSGTAYATYQLLWPNPDASVSKPTTSTSGRTEVSLLFSSCGEAQAPERYELKRDASINKDQIEGVVKAQCELQAINEWAMKTYKQGKDGGFGDARTTPVPQVSAATHILTKTDASVTFAGQEKYRTSATTLEVSKDVRYIANGMDVAPSNITSNDPVVYVTLSATKQTPKEDCTTDACREFGEYRGVQTLVAIVKLDKPFENYDQFAWQSLTERSVCIGNPNDLCLTGYSGSIDLYSNTQPRGLKKNMMTKEIQGVIAQINGATYTIKSSSGSLYTFTTPTDVVSTFNNHQSADYNNQKIQVGNTLSVSYVENENEHTKKIGVDTLFSVTIKLEVTRKGDAPKLY